MKRIIPLFCFLFATILVYADETDFDILTDPKWLNDINTYSNERIDSFILKSVIINGNIGILEHLYINDFHLAALNQKELRLLRNTIYAKYGYSFKDQDLVSYFSKFPWYKSQFNEVEKKLNDMDKQSIKKINEFEKGYKSTLKFSLKDIIYTWNGWNGGADQMGAILEINEDKSFKYTYDQWTSQKTTSLSGTWKIINNILYLDVAEQNLLLGGYYTLAPDNFLINSPIEAKIVYNHNFIIALPIQDTNAPYDSDHIWIEIGSTKYYR